MFVSVLGASPHNPVQFVAAKGETEELLRGTDMNWTILEPERSRWAGQGPSPGGMSSAPSKKPWAARWTCGRSLRQSRSRAARRDGAARHGMETYDSVLDMDVIRATFDVRQTSLHEFVDGFVGGAP